MSGEAHLRVLAMNVVAEHVFRPLPLPQILRHHYEDGGWESLPTALFDAHDAQPSSR